jgi:hypothetical protein
VNALRRLRDYLSEKQHGKHMTQGLYNVIALLFFVMTGHLVVP